MSKFRRVSFWFERPLPKLKPCMLWADWTLREAPPVLGWKWLGVDFDSLGNFYKSLRTDSVADRKKLAWVTLRPIVQG